MWHKMAYLSRSRLLSTAKVSLRTSISTHKRILKILTTVATRPIWSTTLSNVTTRAKKLKNLSSFSSLATKVMLCSSNPLPTVYTRTRRRLKSTRAGTLARTCTSLTSRIRPQPSLRGGYKSSQTTLPTRWRRLCAIKATMISIS